MLCMECIFLYFRSASVTDETGFISLELLGKCLQIIATRQGTVVIIKNFFFNVYCVDIQKERDFSKPFEQGAPNLVITPAGILLVFMLQDIVLY